MFFFPLGPLDFNQGLCVMLQYNAQKCIIAINTFHLHSFIQDFTSAKGRTEKENLFFKNGFNYNMNALCIIHITAG